MLFVKIEDALSSVELLIFPRLYKETLELWQEGKAIIIDGKVSEKDQELKLLVNRAKEIIFDEAQKSIDDFKRMILAGGSPKKTYFNGARTEKKVATPVLEANFQKQPHSSNQVPPLRIIFLADLNNQDLLKVKELFSIYPGQSDVYFRITEEGKNKIIKTAFKVDNCGIALVIGSFSVNADPVNGCHVTLVFDGTGNQ